MRAEEILNEMIERGIPPEGWGYWIIRVGPGRYELSSLMTEGSYPSLEEGTPVYFFSVRKADVPRYPEDYAELSVSDEEVEALLKEVKDEEDREALEAFLRGRYYHHLFAKGLALLRKYRPEWYKEALEKAEENLIRRIWEEDILPHLDKEEVEEA